MNKLSKYLKWLYNQTTKAPAYLSVRLQANANISVPANYSYAKVPINYKEVATPAADDYFSFASNEITVKKDGYYRISGTIAANANIYAAMNVAGERYSQFISIIGNQAGFETRTIEGTLWYLSAGSKIFLSIGASSARSITVSSISKINVEYCGSR